MTRSLNAVALGLLLVLLAGACVTTPPRTLILHPIDLTDPLNPETLRKLLGSAEMQLPAPEEYYLGPGDIITIRLIGRPDILGGDRGQEGVEFRLTDSSTISLPMIGAVSVRNKTVAQLQQDLSTAYAAFVKDPRPLVIVNFFNRNQVTVLGSVREPGKYPYEYGDTLLDAVFKAGGVAPGGRGGGMAPGRYLHLYRERLTAEERATLTLEELAERLTVQGQVRPREEIVMPIDELVSHGTLQHNIPVQPGDVILLASAGTVHVQGRVDTPGVVFLGPSVNTVTQAINERGGLRFSASSTVEVVRTYPDGHYATYRMDIRRMRGRQSPDFRVQEGDEIFVYGDPVRAVGEYLGELFRGSVRAGASATYNPVN
ncbi:MAG: polysaccharide export protein [Candidatus Sumerlaeia bacterium]|nr:polysaccharide export protein [Candidatus Sumerlaeia bacterium]